MPQNTPNTFIVQSATFNDSAQPTIPPKLFGKVGVFMLSVGLILAYLIVQLVGIYLFTPVVTGQDSLSVQEIFALGSFDGTVVSLAMLLTGVVVIGLIWAVVQWAIGRNTKINSSQPHSKPHLRQTVTDYLALRPFSLKMAGAFISLWVLFLLGSEALTVLLDKNPTAFMDDLFLSAKPLWLLVSVVVIFVPIYEEWIFRGVLWSALQEQASGSAGVWLATLVTSGLFAVMHLQYDFYAMSTIFVLALILSFARYKSGSLWLPVLIHILNNGVAMWMYVRLQG